MFTKQDIKSMLDQYITGTLDAAGKERLHGMIGNPAYEQVLGELMDEAFEERLAGTYEFPETQQRVKRQLLQQIRGNHAPVRRMFPAGRWWAAAVLFICCCGLAYYLLQRAAGGQAPAVPAHSIQAAGSKAVLVLADGSTVALDSAGGQVIMQGQTAIRRQQGQLQYEVKGNAGAGGFNTLHTPRGGQFRLTLPDGTKVWLNSASSLQYPVAFNGGERVVQLKGQGYFEVAPAAGQPFVVKTASLEVQVLGTSFDVMAYPDEEAVNTTLLQGAVRVRQGSTVQTLRPGQQAIARTGAAEITVREADLNRATAWKNGLFIFNNMELQAILREIARWYDVEIVYQAPPNNNRYGGGISRSKDLAGVLQFLEAGGANHFKIEGRKVIVLP